MKRIVLLLVSIGLAFSLTGCATMPTRGDYVVLDAAPAIVPDAESGVVCFLRESSFMGSGISYFVQENGQNIGLLRSGSYFLHKTAPGPHTYTAETEAMASVTITVQAGKNSYVQGDIGMGFLAGRPQLTEITEQVATPLLSEGMEYTRMSSPEEKARYQELEQKNTPNSGM